MYRLADEKTLRESFCRDSGMYFMLIQSLFLMFLPDIAEHIFNRVPTNPYYIVGIFLVRVISLAELLVALYLLLIFPSQSLKERTREVSLTDDRIICRSLKGVKEYPFPILCDDVSVHLSFKESYKLPPVVKKFTSIEDFLTNAFSKIEENLKETVRNPEMEKKIIINFYKNRKHILILVISASLIGGLENIRLFLEEFRTKYEAYCESKQTVEGAASPKKEEENKANKAAELRGIIFWAGVIAVSVTSLVFLSLIPYLGTSPKSATYSANLALFLIDSFVTIMLIWLAIVKILNITKKMKTEDK